MGRRDASTPACRSTLLARQRGGGRSKWRVEDEFLVCAMPVDAPRARDYVVLEATNNVKAHDILYGDAAIDIMLTDPRIPSATDAVALMTAVRRHNPAAVDDAIFANARRKREP